MQRKKMNLEADEFRTTPQYKIVKNLEKQDSDLSFQMFKQNFQKVQSFLKKSITS